MYYNETMGGFNIFDRLVSNYTCRRSTSRWTMRIFHYLIDAMAVNSLVIYCENVGVQSMKEEFRLQRSERRFFLQTLAKQLMDPIIENRSRPLRNLQGISKCLQYSFEASGHKLMFDKEQHDAQLKKRGRCSKCLRDVDRKISTLCVKCNSFVCKIHSKTVAQCN